VLSAEVELRNTDVLVVLPTLSVTPVTGSVTPILGRLCTVEVPFPADGSVLSVAGPSVLLTAVTTVLTVAFGAAVVMSLLSAVSVAVVLLLLVVATTAVVALLLVADAAWLTDVVVSMPPVMVPAVLPVPVAAELLPTVPSVLSSRVAAVPRISGASVLTVTVSFILSVMVPAMLVAGVEALCTVVTLSAPLSGSVTVGGGTRLGSILTNCSVVLVFETVVCKATSVFDDRVMKSTR